MRGGTGRFKRIISGDTINVMMFNVSAYASKAAAIAGTDYGSTIDTMLSTGYNLKFNDGYYGTTGNHALSTDTQGISGSGRRNYTNDEGGTAIVRISGSNPMFQRNNQINGFIQHITLDGNDVNAVLIEDLVCFYAKMFDVEFKNCGSSSGALYLDRNNLNEYRHLFFDTNITHLNLVDNVSASNLNIDFYNLTLAQIKNGFSGTGYGINIESGVGLNFYGLKTDDYAPIKVAPASGYAVDMVNFYGFQFENDNDGTATTPYIDFDNNAGSGVRGIHFRGVRMLRAHASNVQDIFRFRGCQNVSIEGLHIEDKTESASNIIELDNTDQWSFKDIFYINTQSAGSIDVDIIDAITSDSDYGEVENVVYSGGSTTGKIKLYGDHIKIGRTNCGVSWNGASSDVTAEGLTTSIDGTNLTNWNQNFDGYEIGEQAVLATNATDGFKLLPTCAGTPTGTPTSYTGKVSAVYDTTGEKLWVYNGAWVSVTLT